MWLWERKGHQGFDWKPAAITLTNSNEPYTVSKMILLHPDWLTKCKRVL